MELKNNVIIDKLMSGNIAADTLSVPDKVKLTLANFLAELFPDDKVYINPQNQILALPSLFVKLYEVHKSRKLQLTAGYDIYFNLAYIAKDAQNQTELDNAEFKIMQNITDLQDYAVQSVDSDITDGITNIKGKITVLEENVPDDPIIINAEKELK